MESPHLRIAVATNSLVDLDANFVGAKQVVFFDVSHDSSEFVDVVHFRRKGKKGPGGGAGLGADGCCVMEDMGDDDGTGNDPLVERVEALDGCSVLFSLGLSDLAALRVHHRQVFPVTSERTRSIDDVIANVQRMMNATPPLWMRRVMRSGDGSRLPLDEQAL